MGKKNEPIEEVDRQTDFPFHAKTKEECFRTLGITSSDFMTTGLTTAEAEKRLALYGPNKLTEKEQTTLLQRIWKQVANVLVGILVFVACVAAIQAVRARFEGDGEGVVTNTIQVGLILFVIT